MIVRTTPPTPNTSYSIYNLGQNKILAGQSVLNGIGDWDFAGPGAVNWDFVQQTLDLFVSRPNPAQNATDFLVYNIDQRGNITKTPAAFLGTIGQPVQVAGFGYFFLAQLNPRSDFGQADMVTRTVTGNDATYRIYDTESDKLNGFITAAVVGDNFKTAGFGTFVPTDPNDLNNFAGLMVLRDSGTGQMLAYAFRDGALVNLPNEQNFAAIGDPWVVLGFGKFSSQVPLGMITRNTVTNEFLIYDINQTFDQNNTPIYTAASAGTLIKSTDGVNSNMTLAGFAPIAGSSPFGATFDMVLRDNSSGKFYFYDIQDDKLVV